MKRRLIKMLITVVLFLCLIPVMQAKAGTDGGGSNQDDEKRKLLETL